MPVPASYNDIGEDASLRDHVGLVWYDRRFHVPPWWIKEEQRVWLRFSSVHYAAQVVRKNNFIYSFFFFIICQFSNTLCHLHLCRTNNINPKT